MVAEKFYSNACANVCLKSADRWMSSRTSYIWIVDDSNVSACEPSRHFSHYTICGKSNTFRDFFLQKMKRLDEAIQMSKDKCYSSDSPACASMCFVKLDFIRNCIEHSVQLWKILLWRFSWTFNCSLYRNRWSHTLHSYLNSSEINKEIRFN